MIWGVLKSGLKNGWLNLMQQKRLLLISHFKKLNKSKLNLTFKGEDLIEVSEHKHLGIVLTSDLKWSSHIDSCCSKGLKK